MRLLFLALLFLVPSASTGVDNVTEYAYLPIAQHNPAIPKTGGAGVFHGNDCQQLGMATGQNWITRRAYVPECAVFIPNISCTVRPYGDYINGRLQLQEAQKHLPHNYAGYILFLNEPLYTGQCNITPYNAALLYWQTVELFPRACISSPNFSDLAIRKYRANVNEYVQEIANQTPEGYRWNGFCFWAIHNYHVRDPDLVYNLTINIMAEWGDGAKPLWVTEYGATKPQHVEPLMKATLCHQMVDVALWWSPYSDDPTALRNKNGLTPVGVTYVEVLEKYREGRLCNGM